MQNLARRNAFPGPFDGIRLFPALVLLALATCPVLAGTIPVVILDDDDDNYAIGPLVDPIMTLMFRAPAIEDKSSPGGWGKLVLQFSGPITQAVFTIDPVCPTFMNPTITGDTLVVVGPGGYKIPKEALVTVQITSDNPVTLLTGVGNSYWKYKSDKPADMAFNVAAIPLPEPATLWLLGAGIALLGLRRCVAGAFRRPEL